MAPSICLQFPAVSDNSERRWSTASLAHGVSSQRFGDAISWTRDTTPWVDAPRRCSRGRLVRRRSGRPCGDVGRRDWRSAGCAPFFSSSYTTYYARRSRFWPPTLAPTLSPRGSLPLLGPFEQTHPLRKRQFFALRRGRSSMSAGPGSLAAALAAFARPELSPEHAEITFTAAALGSHEHGPLAMSR